MATVKEDPTTPQTSRANPIPNSEHKPSEVPLNVGSSNNNSSMSRNAQSQQEFIAAAAAKIAAQPLQFSDPDVWGVLTAISEKARKRRQHPHRRTANYWRTGLNMLLTSDEHCIGRLVDDARFQIIAPAVSAQHCKIYRNSVSNGDAEHPTDKCSVFLKDSSTNGTYLNWDKLSKSSPEAKLRHGDIISIALAPEHELAFAFVFREVQRSSDALSGLLKRKAEEFGVENKRLKGIGIGSSDGPISLDDMRSLKRSNTELRKVLEDKVADVESLRKENHAAVEKHEAEMREMKESISRSYLDQISELKQSLEAKDKDLAELSRKSGEQKHDIEDLNEKLAASEQSCVEANEIINSQKVSISELETLLDGERDQRREEREKASLDLKQAVQRVQAEAADEIKRMSECALRREKEQQEMINKLQESEKERCSLVEILRSKLEDTRQKVVNSDNRVRQLEAQLREEQLAIATSRKRNEELEHERKNLRKELESQKAAREEAWTKVSALELEINTAMRELDFERGKLKDARERIMLRETQLRAFYSTTEEITLLFAKQQEQLKAMQRTLEDEENYETTSIEGHAKPENGTMNKSTTGDGDDACQSKCVGETGLAAFHSGGTGQLESSSDEASVTEKHECHGKSQENGEDTQEVEFTTAECVNAGFGSDINGIGTAPVSDGDPVGTEHVPDTEAVNTIPDAAETERVMETESLGINDGKNMSLSKCSNMAGNAVHTHDDANTQEAAECGTKIFPETSHQSRPSSPHDIREAMEDTEGGETIRTADLLASEVAGSWALSTAPSVQGENDSPGNRDVDEGPVPVQDSCSLVAESQHIPSSNSKAAARRNQERRALSEMIGIVAPDLREQFSRAVGSDEQERGVASDSDTEGCSDNDGADDRKGAEASDRVASDAETVDGERDASDGDMDANMDVDDETQEDSVG